jgi:hypothetical protein
LLFAAAGAKEILLLDVAVIFGVWALIEGESSIGRARIVKVALLLSAAFCLVWLFVSFESLPHPADKNYFARYYSYLGLDLKSFVLNGLTAPWRIVDAVGAKELVAYAATVFVPWLGLPLVWWFWCVRGRANPGGRETLFFALVSLAIVPSLASSAIATYLPLRRSGFHYVLELWPVMAVLCIIALPRFDRWLGGKLPWAWALVALISLDQDPWNQMREYWRQAWDAAPARKVMMALPVNEGIAADELAGTWVAGRLLVTRWPDLSFFQDNCPHWVILPEGRPAPMGCSRVETPVKAWTAGGWSGYRLRN